MSMNDAAMQVANEYCVALQELTFNSKVRFRPSLCNSPLSLTPRFPSSVCTEL